jgi:tripartite-type tricarboxylate transporter receptor subunit TctC
MRYAIATLALVLVFQIATVYGQVYPSKPIRILVGVPAGTGPDVETRQFGTQLSLEVGQQVIVENRPGDSGLIATDAVAKAAADGYTLLAVQPGFATHPRRQGIDAEREFAAVSLLGKHPWVLYVHPSVPAKTLAEFIAVARAQPERFAFGTRGVASFNHLTGELFQALSGSRLKHVPYASGNPMNDLLGGHIDAMFYPLIGMVDNVRAGKLRALAISTGNGRSPQLPEVPTFAEAGLPQYNTYAWFGIVAPAGVPAPVMDKLAAASSHATQSAAFREFLSKLGASAVGSTPAEFAAFLKSERARWKKIVGDLNLKLD